MKLITTIFEVITGWRIMKKKCKAEDVRQLEFEQLQLDGLGEKEIQAIHHFETMYDKGVREHANDI